MMTLARLLLAAAIGCVLAGQTIGVDAHMDTLQRTLLDGVDLGIRQPRGHADLPRLRQGGVNVPFFALWVPTYYHGAEAVRRTLDLRDAFQKLLDAHPDQIELALAAADVERITRAGKIAAVLTVEGGHQIDGDLSVLRVYHHLGVRSMTLTHFRNNDLGDAATDQPLHKGLTDFGRQVVREMNRLGMVVDVSHVSDQTLYDTLAVTGKPVIASHSSCRALSDIPRNLTDDMLRALARNGGVVGINFGEGFLNPKDAGIFRAGVRNISFREPDLTGQALDQYEAEQYHRQFAPVKPFATLEDAVAHIDHAVKIAGIDHVGIGSDFDGIAAPPRGLEDVSRMPVLRAALLKRGYSEADVAKISGGNFLRVLKEAVGR